MKRSLVGTCLVGLCAVVVFAQAPPPASQPARPQAARAERQRARRPLTPTLLLRLPVASVAFDGEPLSAVLDQLADSAGVNFYVRWSALETLGVERDTPVSLNVSNVTFATVLRLVLQEAAGPDARLAFRADRHLLEISSQEDLAREMPVRVYDVRDLLMKIPIQVGFASAREHQIPISNGRNGLVSEVIRSGSRVSTSDYGQQNAREDDRENDEADETMQDLINLITTTVEPDSWSVNGGPATIEPWRGRLVVRNSIAVHQQLGGPFVEEGDAPAVRRPKRP